MRRRTPLILIAAVGLALAGCGGTGKTAASPSAPAPSAAFPASAGGVTVQRRPTHIVSLSPTATEMLFAIGAGKQVVAVDDQSDYPADAPRTDLSGYKPNAEQIAAKQPDLVVISDDTAKIKDQLTKLKIPVYQAVAATTLDDSYREITDLGTLTGHPAEATTSIAQIRTGLDGIVKNLPARSKPLTYYYELDPTYYSVTSKTFIGSVLGWLGLRNIADPADKQATGYPQLSAEAIVNANPDFVFLADTKCCGQSAATVAKRAGWSGLTAVQKNQVVALDDDIASRWGPRVVDLLRTVADAVAKAPTS